MVVGHKHRLWEVFISVSASGPEHSSTLNLGGPRVRPRMAADLRYTTSDVDFLYEHFTSPEADRPRKEDMHLRLVNPALQEVEAAFERAEKWLSQFKDDPDWDGGGIHFNFAGHGREGDGAILLADGLFLPGDFIDRCCSIAEAVSSPGRLRISAVLDSCHSGYWVAKILDSAFNRHNELIVPFNIFASCMHDEYAYEDSSLAHGLFTYCFSTTATASGSFAATGIQPDNTFGPTLSIAAGERGCSIVSGGAQNPVAYWNGAGMLEVAQRTVELENESRNAFKEEIMLSNLIRLRDRIREQLEEIQSLKLGTSSTDEEMKTSIREARERIEKMSAYHNE